MLGKLANAENKKPLTADQKRSDQSNPESY